MLTAMPTSTPTYEVTADEKMYILSNGGEGRVVKGLDIAIGNVWTEDYVDKSGATVKRWKADMPLINDQCLGGSTVHIGDVVEFAGYQIRVLDINDDNVVVAISGQLENPSQIVEDCISNPLYQLPSETSVTLYQSKEKSDSLEFEKIGEVRAEEYINTKGEAVKGPAIKMRITSDGQRQSWEGTVHVGDVIEYGGYRIRIQTINEVFVDLVYGSLSEAEQTPEK